MPLAPFLTLTLIGVQAMLRAEDAFLVELSGLLRAVLGKAELGPDPEPGPDCSPDL